MPQSATVPVPHNHNTVLAVIGVGHLASYTLAAMRKTGFAGRVQLSPRGADMASRLSTQLDCIVCDNNAAAITGATHILLATRPEHAESALSDLSIQPGQCLLSAVSGLDIARLAQLSSAQRIERIMPSSFVEHGHPFMPMFPGDDTVASLFGEHFPVVALNSEQQFDESMIMSCAYAWQLGMMQAQQDWFVASGWQPDVAREMVLRHVQGAVDSASGMSGSRFGEILAGIATPGTYTRHGYDELVDKGGETAIQRALDAVASKLKAI